LYIRHPEMITVRYQENLLIGPERLKWVRKQLDDMLTATKGYEAGMVLAYLGYQYDNPLLIVYGLDQAQAVAPDEPLMPVLRKLWLNADAPARIDGNSLFPG